METCQSSGLLSADAVISNAPARIHGITLIQASAACSVVIYDNASAASGTVVAQVNNVVNATSVFFGFNTPVECLNGAYADVTGTGASFIVHFNKI